MSKPSRLLALAALSALAVAGAWQLQHPAAAQEKEKPKENAPPAAAAKWEYRILVASHNAEKEAEKELNKLGEEGFEVAFVTGGQLTDAIVPATRGGGGGGSKPTFHYTLKRAKK